MIEKLKKLLKVSSVGISHLTNTAKEYVLLEDDTFLEIGKNCFLLEGMLFTVKIENNSLITSQVKERYNLCYGISLVNVINLLSNIDYQLLSITKIKEDYSSYFVITVKNKNSYYDFRSFTFKETNSLYEFSHSDLCHFLIDKYQID
jgi:hypothetical protein